MVDVSAGFSAAAWAVVQRKPEARILDMTAGNRTIYARGMKELPGIIYIDIEPNLQIQPDAVMDCRKTGFPDGYFHTVIFDPPHSFGHTKNRSYNTSPNNRDVKPEWGHHQVPAYYGADKYPTALALKCFILSAAREANRVLASGGWVLFKWGENHAPIDAILTLLYEAGFMEVMRTSRRYRRGSVGGVWVMLVRRVG